MGRKATMSSLSFLDVRYLVATTSRDSCLDLPSSFSSYLKKDRQMSTKKKASETHSTQNENSLLLGKLFKV